MLFLHLRINAFLKKKKRKEKFWIKKNPASFVKVRNIKQK